MKKKKNVVVVPPHSQQLISVCCCWRQRGEITLSQLFILFLKKEIFLFCHFFYPFDEMRE